MDKQAQSLAIVLLVVLTLAIVGTSIFYFVTKEKEINKKISDVVFLEDAYAKSYLFDFYLQEIADRAAVGISSEQEFINNFRELLEVYKYKKGEFGFEEEVWIYSEFEEVEKQVNEENVELIKNSGGEIMGVELDLDLRVGGVGREGLSAVYNYEKNFYAEV